MKTVGGATIILSLVVCSHAQAGIAETTLFAVQTGWYNSNGLRSFGNYLAGDGVGSNYHNFSVFDLSSITLPIQSATLMLFNGSAPPNPADGYTSPDPFETYALFEVSTDIGLLTSSGGPGVYDDLAVGTFFGSVDVTPADNGTFIEVDLNADSIAALNSATGLFAFGGAITTISHPVDVDESVFGFSYDSSDVRLVVTIPEPMTLVLLATFGLGAGRRRR
jgi:hypothetical protein